MKATQSEAQFHIVLGDLERAEELCRQARTLLISCGLEESDNYIKVMDVEADIHLLKTQYSECRSLHVTIARATSHSPLFHGSSLAHIAYMDLLTGAAENEILKNLETAKALFTANRLHWGLLFVETTMVDICLRRGDKDVGRMYQALLYRPGMDRQLIGRCFQKLGDPTLGISRSTYTFVYLGHTRKIQDLASTYDALRCLGDLFQAQGNTETALSLFSVALDGSTAMGIHLTRAICMTRLGHIFASRGDMARAQKMWRDAQPLFARASQTNEVVGIEERLHAFQIDAGQPSFSTPAGSTVELP